MKCMHFFLMSALIPALTQAMDKKKILTHIKLDSQQEKQVRLSSQAIVDSTSLQSPRKKESPRDKIAIILNSSKPSTV